MGLKLNYDYGQTPLSEDEILGLQTISTQAALEWVRSKKPATAVILSEGMIIGVHKSMFSEVWSWAGIIRRSQKKLELMYP
jgi:fido (protein-threonine AMPylation protein)